MFLYVTEERRVAERMIEDVVSAALNRPADDLRQRLLIGEATDCAEKLAAYQVAGVQRVFVWPVDDELAQLETFATRVAPAVR